MKSKFIKKMLFRVVFLAALFFFSIPGLLCQEEPLKVSAENANIYLEFDRESFMIERTEKKTLLTPFKNTGIKLISLTSYEGQSQREEEVIPKLSKTRKNCLKVRAGYFRPSERSSKDIYGGGMTIGGEINIKLWKSLDLWFIADYYFKNGRLPFTKEKTKMTLIPIGGGPKINFRKGRLNLYLGFGPLIYVYKETNPIGVAKGTDLGITGQAGCYVNIVGRLLFDVSLNYSYCSVKPQKIKADLGGILAGIGIGYEF